MRKKHCMWKKAIAFALAMSMLCGLWTSVGTTQVFAEESITTGGVIATVDDPQTLTRPVDTFGNSTLNAGKILVGKSVTDGIHDETGEAEPLNLDAELVSGTTNWLPDENNFLVTVSQTAQMYGVSSKIPVPLDVVFVLDTSGSMATVDPGATGNRTVNAVEAINTTIKELMELNDENRVSIVAFSGHNSDWANDGATTAGNDAANVLSELQHYNGEAATAHLTLNTQNGLLYGRKIIDGSRASRNGYSGGTNIQAGIALGAQQLANEKDTTVTIAGKEITRMPFIILVSDGQPIMSSPNNQWWNPDMIEHQNGFTKDGSSDSYGTYTYAGNGFLPVLVASYYKELISKNYFPQGNDFATIYTVGVGLDKENSANTPEASNLARMTLNPSGQFNDASGNPFYKDFETYWKAYDAGEAFRIKVFDGPFEDNEGEDKGSHDGYYYFYPKDVSSGNQNDYQTFTENSKYDRYSRAWVDEHVWVNWEDIPASEKWKDNIQEEVTSLLYNDAYYDVENSTELAEVLKKLVIEIQKRAITDPTYVDEVLGEGFSGYVTFTDPIGEYMEVKRLVGITGDGYVYDGKEFARKAQYYGTENSDSILDSTWEDAVLTRIKSGGTSNVTLTQVKTLLKTVTGESETYGGQIYYNSEEDYSNSFVWFGNLHYPEGTDGSAEEDYQIEFVDVAPKDADTMEWLEANASSINNANCIVRSYYIYGSASGAEETTGEQLLFSIRKIQALEAPYQQYMSISAPASLLSVQEVLIDDTDPSNIEAHFDEIQPVRVTYEVGLRSDITADNVNGKVTPEYLEKYGNVNADGTINFYTNDYKRYESAEDAAGHTQAPEHDHALTNVKFDVSDTNSFYRYETDTLLLDAEGKAITSTPEEGKTYYYERVYYQWEDSESGVSRAQRRITHIPVIIPDGALERNHLLEKEGKWYIKEGTYTASTITSGDDILKTENETVTAHIVSHPKRTRTADNSHYTTWLGNNGKLTFKAINPKTVHKVENGDVGTANIDGELVKVGDILNYQIQVTNTYDTPADITISDEIPEGTKLVEDSIREGSKADGEIQWDTVSIGKYDADKCKIIWGFEDVAPGTTKVVSFNVEVTESAVTIEKVQNDATIAYPEHNNSYTTNITKNPVTGKAASDLSGNELPEEGVKVGDVIEYKIAYFNDGETVATFTITDSIPRGTTYIPDSATHNAVLTTNNNVVTGLTWTLENIQPGTGGVVTFDVVVNAASNTTTGITNQAFINSPEIETNIITLPVKTGDLDLKKTVTGINNSDGSFEITLTETTKLLNGEFVVEGDTANAKVTFVNGVATLMVKNGQTLTVKGLPAGAIILVTEDNPGAGYTATISNDGRAVISENSTPQIAVTNTYKAAPVTIKIGGTKSFTNNNTIEEQREFFFILEEKKETQAANTPAAQATDYVADVTIKAGVGETQRESFRFAELTYTEAGVYKYTVKEQNAGASGMVYDATEYTVTVIVEDNGTGQLEITSVEYTGGQNSGKLTLSNGIYGTGELVFHNSLNALNEALSLVGRKVITNTTLTDDQFSFVVKENGKEVVTGQSKADGSIVFTELSYTAADIGEHIYTIEEVTSDIPGVTTDTKKYYLRVVVSEINAELQLEVYTRVSETGAWTEVTDLGVLTSCTDDSYLVFNNVYIPEDYTVTLEGKKKLIGRSMATDEFDFIVTDSEGNQVAIGSNASPEGDTAEIVFQPISYSFEDLEGKPSKTFTYLVKEVDEGQDGITYSDVKYTVTVEVSYDATKGWSSNVTYSSGNILFENIYTPAPIDVPLTLGNKTTTTTAGNTKELPEGLEFGYEVIRISGPEDGVNAGTIVATGRSGANGEISLAPIRFTQAGTYVMQLVETDAGKTQHGVTYDNAKYIIKVTVENENGTLTPTVEYFAEDGQTTLSSPNLVKFENQYDAKGSLTIQASKQLDGRTGSALAEYAGRFDFVLKNTKINDVPVENGLTHVGYNNTNGMIVFDTLNYTEDDCGDVFTYQMWENPGNVSDVDYDKSVYEVVVTVPTSENGVIELDENDYIVKKIADRTGQAITSQKITNRTPEFKNIGKIYKGVSTTVTVNKVLTGRDMENGEFSIVVKQTKAEKKAASGDGYVEVENFTPAVEDTTFVEKGSASLDIFISAAEGPGKYTFEISEVDNGLGGITYDKSVYQLVLEVDDIEGTTGKDGVLDIVSQTLTKIKDASGNDETNIEPFTGTPQFENKYKPKAVSVQLKGAKKLLDVDSNTYLSLKADEFGFAIYDSENKLVETGSQDEEGVITFTPMNFTTEGTYEYSVKELQNNKHPGVQYSSDIYSVEIEVSDNEKGQLEAKVEVKKNNEEYVTYGESVILFQNEYNAEDTKANIVATKTLIGRDMTAGEFSFEIYEVETADAAIGADATPVSIGTNEAATDGNSAAIKFSQIPYSSVGTHYYVIKETSKDGNGITVDKDEIRVTVQVTDVNGKLVATTSYPAGKQAAEFENRYQPTEIHVPIPATKNLTGKKLTVGEFEFEIRDSEGNVIATGTNQADGKIVFDYDLTKTGNQEEGISFRQGGTYTYTVAEKETASNYNYDKTKYKVQIVITDHGNGTLTSDVKYPDGVPTFYNTYIPTPVSVQIVANKELTGRELKDKEFKFSVKTLDGTLVATGTNQTDGKIVFDCDPTTEEAEGIRFTTPGTYRYAVSEDTSAVKSGVTMDPTIWYVQITVTQDETSGVMTASQPLIIDVINGASDQMDEILFKNTYQPESAKVVLEGDKTLTGRDMKEGEFAFHLLDKDGLVVAEGVTDAQGNIIFEELTFDTAGEYEYKLVEIPETSEHGITYDQTEYSVTIDVVEEMIGNDYAGKLKANVSINKGGTPSPIKFANSYEASPTDIIISGYKKLIGGELKNKQFAFELHKANESYKALELLGTVRNSEAFESTDGTFTYAEFAFEKITYNEPGVYHYVVKEKIENAKEIIYDEHQYHIKVEVTDNSMGQLVAQKTLVNDVEMVYENIVFDETTEKTVFKKDDMTVSIDGEAVVKGDILTYEIEYTNYRGTDTTVTITDAVPKHTSYVKNSATNGGIYKDGVITWKLDVAPDETVKVYFDVIVEPDKDGIRGTQEVILANKARIDDGKNKYETNEVVNPTSVSEDAKLFAVKYQAYQNGERTKDKLKVKSGDVVKYTIVITNAGGQAATNVVVSDGIPTGLLYVKDSVNEGGSVKDGTVTWEISELKSGEKMELSFEVKVPNVNKTTVWKNIGYVEYQPNSDKPKEEVPTNEVEIEELVEPKTPKPEEPENDEPDELVEVYPAPQPTAQGTGAGTGDSASISGLIGLVALALVGFVGLTIYKRKKR